ncbi:hypothetical protein C2S51_035690 [Perilla frutescens var. frutescens]|nr:hypothetical protein C2S51_035690 [Perilla frutescens var. frutescens]
MKKEESEDDAENLALIQQLKELECIWRSIQNSRPRSPRTSSSSHSYSYSNSNSITSFDENLFQNSPRTLMSSLQHRKPAFGLKNCSSAVEEILMDRRAAILSGRFKGRQLFGAEERTSSVEEEDDGIQEREVMMMNYDQHDELPPFDFSEPSEDKVVVEEKTVVEVADAAEKRAGGDGRRRREKAGCGCMPATACLALVLIVFALVFFSMSCHAKYHVQDHLVLVPT